jgi:hypothetical protein
MEASPNKEVVALRIYFRTYAVIEPQQHTTSGFQPGREKIQSTHFRKVKIPSFFYWQAMAQPL